MPPTMQSGGGLTPAGNKGRYTTYRSIVMVVVEPVIEGSMALLREREQEGGGGERERERVKQLLHITLSPTYQVSLYTAVLMNIISQVIRQRAISCLWV